MFFNRLKQLGNVSYKEATALCILGQYDLAWPLLLKAAEKGDLSAQCDVAAMYDEGIGCVPDKAKAFYWYQKAAEGGDAQSQNNLAICYDKGIGCATDEKKAFHWYHEAAKQGYRLAQFNLGLCYSKGKGIQQDKKESFKWYLKAAEQGIPSAQYNVGCAYRDGIGVTESNTEAKYCFTKAANQGHEKARENLISEHIDRAPLTAGNDTNVTQEKRGHGWYSLILPGILALGFTLIDSTEAGFGIRTPIVWAFCYVGVWFWVGLIRQLRCCSLLILPFIILTIIIAFFNML